MMYKRIIVFDLEATGLFPKKGQTGPTPSITQVSYVLYDISEGKITESYTRYIRIPTDIPISEESVKVTGITREKLDKEGIPISEALTEFYKAYSKADGVVGHNLNSFDIPLIRIEANRCSHPLEKEFAYRAKPTFCTMKNSKNICKIEIIGKNGPFFKSPKLIEVYEYLFGKEEILKIVDKLHDAETDVLCCLRCFLYINEHPELYSS